MGQPQGNLSQPDYQYGFTYIICHHNALMMGQGCFWKWETLLVGWPGIKASGSGGDVCCGRGRTQCPGGSRGVRDLAEPHGGGGGEMGGGPLPFPLMKVSKYWSQVPGSGSVRFILWKW